jgi:hypothetical protein
MVEIICGNLYHRALSRYHRFGFSRLYLMKFNQSGYENWACLTMQSTSMIGRFHRRIIWNNEPVNLSQNQAAIRIGVNARRINGIVLGKCGYRTYGLASGPVLP